MSQNASRRPNLTELATDFLMPLLEPAEWACFSYLLRHTYGLDGTGDAEARRGLLAVETFHRGHRDEEGNSLDLGVGLGREAVKHSLEALEKKQLVFSRLVCLNCGWRQPEGAPVPPPGPGMKAPACPECRRKLWPGYGLPQYTVKTLEQALNRVDPHKRTFEWDSSGWTYLVSEPVPEGEEDEGALEEEAERLRNLLWYPELVDAAVKMAEGALKRSEAMKTSRKVRSFYKPVLELQEEFVSAPLIKYALEQTLERRIPFGRYADRWHRYARAICVKNKTQRRFAGAPVDTDIKATRQAVESPKARQEAVRDLLRRAADLNGRGEYEAARALLSDLLADDNLTAVAKLFAEERDFAEASIREAFKQGVSDFVGIDPTDSLGLDFYPEWSWPEGLPTAKERRAREGVSA